jgi:hypothetical protein
MKERIVPEVNIISCEKTGKIPNYSEILISFLLDFSVKE